jgi:hypothetical protein
MTARTNTSGLLRELDHRATNGLEIWLLWQPVTDEITVHVFDELSQTTYRFAVDPQHALDAFRHPFAYLAADPNRLHATTAGDEFERVATIV